VDDATSWRADVAREQRWRAESYLGRNTPLSAEARRAFKGLGFYPIDPRFRLRDVKLERHAQPKPGNLGSTGPDAVAMLEVGVVRFALLGEACALKVFAPAPGEAAEDYLLIPFRDATSGDGTYGAGRYLDLEPNVADRYEIDFNRAYHPYCAHDDAWSCTLPPPDNRLPVKVEAGERL